MKMIKNITAKSTVALAVAWIGLVGCKDNFTSPASPTGSTITTIASGTDSLKVYYAALNKIGQAATFNNVNSGQFTVFAPSNYAFVTYLRSIGVPNANAFTTDSAVNYISKKVTASSSPLSLTGANNTKSLIATLNYHVISTAVKTSQITGAQGFTTQQGARLSLSNVAGATLPYQLNADVTSSGGGSGSNIIVSDLSASNGVVHVVDRVMLPISVANIWDKTLLNFSINYAVTPIAITMTSGSNTVTLVNTPVNNVNNFNVSNAPTDANDGNFNLFSAALIRANLATVINPIGAAYLPDFTVFVPTDGALRAYLGAANEAAAIATINGLDPASLATLINYHIVPGRILSTDLTNSESVSTLLAGKNFTVNISGSTYTLTDLNGTSTDATITTPNKLSNAGVIHLINGVLLSQ